MFSGSLRLFRLFGINVFAHWTFALLLAIIAWQHYRGAPAGGELAAVAQGVGLTLTIFACVVMHEFGHALAARRYKIKTREIVIQIIGGVARLEGEARTPAQELVIAIAGPLVNVVILCVLVPLELGILGVEELTSARISGGQFLAQIIWANFMLVVFNMIPAFPMDGGRVLRALLWYATSHARATTIAARVGQAVAVLFAVVGLTLGWSALILVGVFVFFAAGAEIQVSKMKSAHDAALRSLDRLHAADAMITAFDILDADAPLQAALDRARQTGQSDFPVVNRATGALGLLHRGHLSAAGAVVGSAVVRDLAMAMPNPARPLEPLGALARRMNDANLPAIPVTDDKGIVGLITIESLNRALARISPPA